MAVQDDDKFIVNRGGTDYKVSASDLDDKLKNDDQVLINRGGTDYKVSGMDLRKYLDIVTPPWADAEHGIYHVIITDPAAINVHECNIYDRYTWNHVGVSIPAPGEYICVAKPAGVDRFQGSPGNWQFGPLTDTSKVTSMWYMFEACPLFNSDLSMFDTSNVTDMYEMFQLALSFSQDISGWCVSKIPKKPGGFDTLSQLALHPELQPKWGTCPGGEDKP